MIRDFYGRDKDNMEKYKTFAMLIHLVTTMIKYQKSWKPVIPKIYENKKEHYTVSGSQKPSNSIGANKSIFF